MIKSVDMCLLHCQTYKMAMVKLTQNNPITTQNGILQVKLASQLSQRLTPVIIGCSLDVGRSSPMALRAFLREGVRCRTESVIPGK